MGLLSGLTGGLVGGVADAVDRFVETPDEKAAAELKRRALELQPLLAQIEVNKVEAEHKSWWVAGARPANLWACTLCMCGIIAAGLYGWLTGVDVTPLYVLYGSTVAPVHLGLLGLRSFEKVKGVATHGIAPKR